MNKFNKYRLLPLTMAAVLALSACGGNQAGTNESESMTSAGEMEYTTAAECVEMPDKEDGQGTGGGNPDDEAVVVPTPLSIELSAKYEGEWDDKGAIITADSATIHVLNDGYDALKETLDQYNEMNWQEVYTMYLEHREYAIEGMFPEGTELYISREIEVTRADSKVLSLVNAESSFVGGAHGSFYENAEVFDVESGETLELSAVVTDYDKVYEYVINGLKENYESDMFFADYEDWVHEMFYEPDGAMASPLEWTMDMEGIEFRFSPYIIGPWASGTFEVELPYEGNEDLFVEEYVPVLKGGSIRKIQPEEIIEIDGDRDGYVETIYYTVSENDESFSTTLALHMNEERGLDGGTSSTIEEDYYGTFTDAYLIEAVNPYDGEDEADYLHYLYVEFLSENDFRRLYVIDLNENQMARRRQFDLVGDTDASIYGHFTADSGQFALYSRIYTLGTYTGFKTYYVGDDGMPVSDESMYTLVNEGMDWERGLVSKRELKVQMHVDGSEETVEEKLPKGTVFKPRKTDGETVMEMELEDGRRCDILLEKGTDGVVYKINGISEYDCFEDLPYAG